MRRIGVFHDDLLHKSPYGHSPATVRLSHVRSTSTCPLEAKRFRFRCSNGPFPERDTSVVSGVLATHSTVSEFLAP